MSFRHRARGLFLLCVVGASLAAAAAAEGCSSDDAGGATPTEAGADVGPADAGTDTRPKTDGAPPPEDSGVVDRLFAAHGVRNNEQVPNATLCVLDHPDIPCCKTDAIGTCTLTKIPYGDVMIGATADGHRKSAYAFSLAERPPDTIPNVPILDIDGDLAEAGPGLDNAGAHVIVADGQETMPRYTVTSTKGGTFFTATDFVGLANVDPGEIVLTMAWDDGDGGTKTCTRGKGAGFEAGPNKARAIAYAGYTLYVPFTCK